MEKTKGIKMTCNRCKLVQNHSTIKALNHGIIVPSTSSIWEKMPGNKNHAAATVVVTGSPFYCKSYHEKGNLPRRIVGLRDGNIPQFVARLLETSIF
jgi:hypothetical protein